MKIFPKNQASAPAVKEKTSGKEARESKGISKKKPEVAPKKEISANEIREKLAAHVDTSEVSKNMAIRNSKKFGDGFMNENMKLKVDEVSVDVPEIKTPNTKDLTIKSDVAQNDPRDSNTQEKLKSVIAKGAFNFNPKEREALEKILADT